MSLILTIYKKALAVLAEKPFKLWGISWLATLLISLASGLFLIPIVGIAVSILLSTAMTLIFLAGYRKQKVETLMIFDNFSSWTRIKRVLCGMGWSYLWIFIWSLIPIVGPIFAIIRSYEYRFVPYIMALEPEIAPKDALKESKKQTEGYKASMFWADILYAVIFSVAIGIIFGLGSALAKIYIGYIFIIVAVIAIIAYVLFRKLFAGLVKAAFYDEIKNMPARQKAVKPVCPVCGKQYKIGTKFCPNDGSSLVVPLEEEAAVEA